MTPTHYLETTSLEPVIAEIIKLLKGLSYNEIATIIRELPKRVLKKLIL